MNVSEFCHLCNKYSDQMLMLSCIHDLCLKCAVMWFDEQYKRTGKISEYFLCDTCQTKTVLDSSSIQQLSTLSINSTISVKSSKPSNMAIRKKARARSKSPNLKKPDPMPVSKKTAYFCKQHSEQQISYFCSSCYTTICPECAIHGSHKDHQVKLIKISIKQIKTEYAGLLHTINFSQGHMSQHKDTFLNIIKLDEQSNKKQKSIISHQFDRLRSSLLTKQKEIMQAMDDSHRENVRLVTTFLQKLNEQYEQATKLKKRVEEILRKDQVMVFDEYRNIKQIELSIQAINTQNNKIQGSLFSLNSQLFHENVQTVQAAIQKLKQHLQTQKMNLADQYESYTSQLG